METRLIQKPSAEDVLELIDSECFFTDGQTSECTAPLGYRCPYRRFKAHPDKAPGEQIQVKAQTTPHTGPVRLTRYKT